MIPMWIIYITPEDKVEAVRYEIGGDQEAELTRENNVVVGTPSFKDKFDAINYAKQRWL